MFSRFFQSLLLVLPVALGLTGAIPFSVSAVAAGLAVLALALESGLGRRLGSHGNEVVTVIETLSITIVVSALHQTAALSALVLLPLLLRRGQHPEGITRVSLVAGAFVLFGAWAVTKGVLPTWPEAIAAMAVAAVGSSLSLDVSRPKILLATPPAANPVWEQPVAFPDEQKILEYRESYRRLKGMYEELLRRSDSDRASMCLIEWRFGDAHSIRELAHALRNAAEVDGAAIYTVPDIREGMVLAGASGTAPAEARTLQVPIQAAPILIRERADEALKALKTSASGGSENVILSDRGRLIGLAALYDQNKDRIEHGRRILEDLSPLLARLLRDEQEAEGLRTRAVRAELLADLGTRYLDSTRAEAAQGICEDLVASLKLDGCSVCTRTPEGFATIGQGGASLEPILESLMMGQSMGLTGWAESGARELVIPEARDDVRFDRLAAVRKGVGMVVILPLFSSGSLVGSLIAWTEDAHGINAVMLGTLRAVIPHVLRRCIGGFPTPKTGLVDQDTFWNGSQGPGGFVEIDLGRAEGEQDKSEGLKQARRRVLATAISKLPQGGLLTRRPTGTLVAYLAGFDEGATGEWATTLEKLAEGPWGMSINVLGFSQQSTQFLQKVAP